MELETLFGLVGFAVGIATHILLISAIWRRPGKRPFELVLTLLLTDLLIWYCGNFLSVLLRRMDLSKVGPALSWVDAVAFSALSFVPALLLHIHWLYYRQRFSVTRKESGPVYLLLLLLYGQVLLLPQALRTLVDSPGVPPIEKLGPYETPFLLVLAASYLASAYLQLRIVRRSERPLEKSVFKRLIVAFLAIPGFNFLVFVWGGSQWAVGSYLLLGAFMASLIPTFVIGYYIYRYQFLQVRVHRSLATALILILILLGYAFGIRSFGEFLVREYGAPAPLIEGVFLAALLILMIPLGQWLEKRVSLLFSGEIRRLRELTEAIDRTPADPGATERLKGVIEEKLRTEFPDSSVELVLSESTELPSDRNVYPLMSASRQIGYLRISPKSDLTQHESSEAIKLSAREIAEAFERIKLLENRLELEREVARKSRMESLGLMAATVAHNVKNPLNSIKMLLQLQAEAPNLNEEQRHEIGMMTAEIDRLARTVSELLRFSRLGTGADQPVPTRAFNLVSFLEETLNVFRGDLESRGITLETHYEVEDTEIALDPAIFTDIVVNLLTNSIDACSPEGRIVVTVEQKRSQLVLVIQDDGSGIPDEVQAKVFEPFFTTKSTGTGLGLPIVRTRIDQLGGSLKLESPLGQRGTRFTVILPGLFC